MSTTAILKLNHRGIAYQAAQQTDGAWQWKLLPRVDLHAYDYATASGLTLSRERADAAARAAIDAQLDA